MTPGNEPDDISVQCPTTEVLAAYLDRQLITEEQALLEKHLVVCTKCRHILSIALKSTDTVSLPDTPEN
jgi:predicted anti-sigma-YlaC factor YlaD